MERNKKYAKKTKNVPLSQNEVHKSPFGSKMLSYVAHHDIELTCLPCMDLLYVFTAIATCGLNRLSMALRDLVWPCMDFVCPFHSLFVVLYGLLWLNIVFSRGHRSKFIWSCSRKMKAKVKPDRFWRPNIFLLLSNLFQKVQFFIFIIKYIPLLRDH